MTIRKSNESILKKVLLIKDEVGILVLKSYKEEEIKSTKY